MKRIVLIRHAKSSWSDPDLADTDRPLNQRGRLASTLVGAWLQETGFGIDHVWLSPAARSAETWRRIRHCLSRKVEEQTHKALYMADPMTMLNLIRSTPEGAQTAAMVGHQPGLSSFARKLSNGPRETFARAFTKFPTGAVAVIEMKAKAWPEVDFGTGHFVSFTMPKELV